MIEEALLRTGRLWVVGNLNRDLKTAPLPPGDYLCGDGETPVDFIHETIGGGGANSAAMAAGLGAQVSFVGQVGDDPLGRRLEDALARLGIHCRIHRHASHPTGTTLNLVYESGRRHFLSCHPNNRALAYKQFDLSGLPSATHLLRADIWFSEAMLYEGNARLFAGARAAGVPISIDLNWDPQWGRVSKEETERRKAAVRQLLPWVNLAHGNVRELCEFTGDSELPTAVSRLLDWGVGAVVAHLGARGSGWFSAHESVIEPAAPVSAGAVAATGTGDLLSVCMMLLHHLPEVPCFEKLRLANRVVAEFIQGKRELIPRL